MNIKQLQQELDLNGLGNFFETLQPLLRNAIRLHQRPEAEANIATGQTKIGGKPDLPEGMSWATEAPVSENKGSLDTSKAAADTQPLSFIAQINLSEIAPFDKGNLLPKTGLLYFFYCSSQEAWGFDVADKDKFKVIYWDGDFTKLKRTDFPENLPEYAIFKPCVVDIESELSFPPVEHAVYRHLNDDEEDIFWEKIYDEDMRNKLLGYSDNIQNEMELDCEMVTNGINCGNPEAYRDPRVKQLSANAPNWQLLLQIDSNDENDMMWGDSGRLYFWIRKDDLREKRFERAWFGLQCC